MIGTDEIRFIIGREITTQTVAVLTKINELASRYEVKARDFDAVYDRTDGKESRPVPTLTFQIRPTGDEETARNIGKMLRSLEGQLDGKTINPELFARKLVEGYRGTGSGYSPMVKVDCGYIVNSSVAILDSLDLALRQAPNPAERLGRTS